MSFRERSAWITLVSVAVCFGVYFGSIVTGIVPPRGFGTLHLFLLCVIALVLLQVGSHAIAARLSPADRRGPADERERQIVWRSQSLGYQVLAVGMVIGLGGPAHFGHPTPDLLNFALLDIVIAALVVSVAQIVMFRRGA